MATRVNYGRAVLLAAIMLGITPAAQAVDTAVRVGSKIDTEGSLLGNIILQVLKFHQVKAVNKLQLCVIQVLRGAITAGEIDIYPEYTGNGTFFFSSEQDKAWKDTNAGYQKVKKLDYDKIISSGLARRRPIIPGPLPYAMSWPKNSISTLWPI